MHRGCSMWTPTPWRTPRLGPHVCVFVVGFSRLWVVGLARPGGILAGSGRPASRVSVLALAHPGGVLAGSDTSASQVRSGAPKHSCCRFRFLWALCRLRVPMWFFPFCLFSFGASLVSPFLFFPARGALGGGAFWLHLYTPAPFFFFFCALVDWALPLFPATGALRLGALWLRPPLSSSSVFLMPPPLGGS